jgi:hypothetical protein
MIDPTATLFTPRDAQNYKVYSAWMFGSLIAFVAATLLIDGKYVPTAVGWLLTAATAALMLVAMRSYILFLRHADELLRKVHLESLALGFGAGVVVMMSYRLCERLGAPKLDVNDAALIMMVTWVAGQWLGARRYAPVEEQ